MTVHIENIGGGGSAFPPKGTQVSDFLDTFDRPNAQTLGSRWGTAWLQSDGHFQDTSRPGPFNVAVNPSIANNTCAWWTRRDGGVGFTVAFPWSLAWMTQGFFNQYAQFEIVFIQQSSTNVEAHLCLCYSGNPGTLTGGFYFLAVNGDTSTISIQISRAQFGFNPSATPSGDLGDAGLTFYGVTSAATGIPITSIIRFEARRVNDAWNLTGFADDDLLIEGTDNHLGQGMPAMSASQYLVQGIQLNPMCSIDNYQAGLLR